MLLLDPVWDNYLFGNNVTSHDFILMSHITVSSCHFLNGLRFIQHPGVHGATCAVDNLMEIFHYCINQSINQSIKSSFVKGAGANPQNAPCRRRSHALKKAPVRRGRLLSTVFHR